MLSYKQLSDSEKIITVFLDLAKPFDTVDHGALIRIIPNDSTINESLNWFVSYLENKKQMFTVNGELGNEKQIKYSVPQGNVSGPVLFILYKTINSIS